MRESISLLLFFALTYTAAWAFFVPVMLTSGERVGPVHGFLITIGAYMPSVVALALSSRAAGGDGVRALLERLLAWRAPVRWYLFAASFIAVVKLTAAIILRLTTGAWPAFGSDPLALLPFAVVLSTPFQAGEEIGWRGYALPRLAARLGLRWASLLLGGLWALWHLPLFFLRGADTYGQSFPVYLVGVVALSATLASLYARTGTLWPAMLFHSAANNTKDIVPSRLPEAGDPFGWSASPVGWVTVLLLWVAAAVFLARMPDRIADPPRESDKS